MPNDQQGVKLPVPGKDFSGNPKADNVNGRVTVFKFSNEEKSPAKANRVIKGLTS